MGVIKRMQLEDEDRRGIIAQVLEDSNDLGLSEDESYRIADKILLALKHYDLATR